MVTTVGELNGVARLLARVVDEKLEEPDKKRVFERLDFVLAVHVVDVGQSASVAFPKGDATVSQGPAGQGRPGRRVRQRHFIQFTMFRTGWRGIPNVFDDNGRSVLHKVLTGSCVIRGLVRHLPALYGFLCFVATAEDG